jgi:hypothetical protein
MAYKSLADLIKIPEQEPMMSEMAPADYEKMQSEVSPDMVYSTPKLTDVLPSKPESSEVPMLAEASVQPSSSQVPQMPQASMSKSEALIAEYNKLLGKGESDLAEARKRDRMLKIGGSIGDALATYLNAQSQMNVKAPGVQIQQGAGLGKVADMFATSPEIASDLAQRREALMNQYKQMSMAEMSKAKRESAEKIAEDRNKLMEEKTRLYGRQVEKMGSGREESKAFRKERAEIQDERYVKDKMLGLKKDFRKDYRYKDAYKEDLAFDQVNKLMDAAKDGNQIAFNAVGTKMARAMSEVGVLTESDVSRYVEGGSLTRKAGDSLLRMINGKPSEATMEDINEITQVLKEAHGSRLAPIFEDFANDAVQQLGKTREQAYKELGFPLPPDLKQQQQETKKQEDFTKDKGIQDYADKFFKGDYDKASRFLKNREGI